MKKAIPFLSLLLLLLSVLASCNRVENNLDSGRSFTWTYKGTSYTAVQDEARLSGIGSPSITAGLQATPGAPGSGPRIQLTSLASGTYSFGAGTGNTFRFIDATAQEQQGASGSATLTNDRNQSLSGSFSVVLTDGNTLTGSFSNTPIRP